MRGALFFLTALVSLAQEKAPAGIGAEPNWNVVMSGDGNVSFFAGYRPVMTYQHATETGSGLDPAYARGGFLHPLFTPSGVQLSDSFPADHPHHHGIWTAWSAVEWNGLTPDFWNVGKRTGGVRVRSKPRRSDDGKFIECALEAFAVTPGGEVVVLHETWKIAPLASSPRAHRFDLEINQRNVSAHELRLKAHHYGGLGLRGRPDWTHDLPYAAQLRFLTSNGTSDRAKGDGEQARWFYFGGPSPNGQVGYAVLHLTDSPTQFTRFNPKDPFVAFTPVKKGPLTIAPDGKLTMRYRILLIDGPPDAAELEAEWRAAIKG